MCVKIFWQNMMKKGLEKPSSIDRFQRKEKLFHGFGTKRSPLTDIVYFSCTGLNMRGASVEIKVNLSYN